MPQDEIERRKSMTTEELDAIEAEQRKALPEWWDRVNEEEELPDPEPVAVARGRGMVEVLKTLRE